MLVSTEEFSADPAELRVFDCRYDLARPDWGESQYRASHIPGAVFAHLDRDLSAPKTGKNGRHPRPDRDDFLSKERADERVRVLVVVMKNRVVVVDDIRNSRVVEPPLGDRREVGHGFTLDPYDVILTCRKHIPDAPHIRLQQCRPVR